MFEILEKLRLTDSSRHVVVPRLIAAVPLIAIGVGHFADPKTFVAILEAAGLPFVSLSAVAAPAAEILAGVLLLLGLHARLGGVIASSTMMAALFAHAVVAPNALPLGVAMPPVALPLAVLAASLYVTWRGAGAWSLDGRRAEKAPPMAAANPMTAG